MEKMKYYKNASCLMAGGSCLLMLVGHLINKTVPNPYGDPLVPGLSHLLGLCILVLCLWFGLTLRMWLKNPKWWLKTLILCLAAFCIYKYRHDLYAYWRAFPYMATAIICLGYLVPEKITRTAQGNRGWEYLIFILVTTFCYTAAHVVESRLEWLTGSYLPEHHDMLRLMLTLMKDIEPLMIILVLYFVLLFSFSKAGQWLGAQKWFFWLASIAAIVCFVSVCTRMNSFGPISYRGSLFLMLLVQPVTIYILVVLYRICRRIRNKETDRDIKSLFTI